MNNPLEFILRKQKMAHGGRIHLRGGGMDMGNEKNQEKSKNMGGNYGGLGGGGNKDRERTNYNANRATTDAALERLANTKTSAPAGNNQTTVKDEGGFGNFLSNLFTPPTAKEQFINKIGFNPKLNKFIKQTYGVNSINDLTDEQVQAINDYNNMSFNELRDLVSNLTGKVINEPLAAGYNTLMGTSLGPQGLGIMGMYGSLANIAMGKPAYSSIPSNFEFTGPMSVDAQGNLVQDFSYTGPMSTNPVVNQKIADLQRINGVTGALTAAQQAEAVAKAVTGSQTGDAMFSFGGDGGRNRPIQQNTVQDTVQSQMDALTDSELSRYNQLIEQGYSDEYAKAYIGML